MGYRALCELGISKEAAYDSVELFRNYDEELLSRQQRIYTDEQKVFESYRDFLSELEHLFESDAQASQLDHEKFEDNIDLDESGLERKPPEHYQKDRIDVTRETEEKRNNLN